jgi:hypothetical protein
VPGVVNRIAVRLWGGCAWRQPPGIPARTWHTEEIRAEVDPTTVEAVRVRVDDDTNRVPECEEHEDNVVVWEGTPACG